MEPMKYRLHTAGIFRPAASPKPTDAEVQALSRARAKADALVNPEPRHAEDGGILCKGGGMIYRAPGTNPTIHGMGTPPAPAKRKQRQPLTAKQERQVQRLLAVMEGRFDLCGRPVDENGRLFD